MLYTWTKVEKKVYRRKNLTLGQNSKNPKMDQNFRIQKMDEKFKIQKMDQIPEIDRNPKTKDG